MAGREKAKKKALHRGLDDIINRDASLTSRLLGRVQPTAREPLPMPVGDAPPDAETDSTSPAFTGSVEAIAGKARTAETSSASAGGPNPPTIPGSPESLDDRTKAAPQRSRKEALRPVPDSSRRLQLADQQAGTDGQRQSIISSTEDTTIISLEEFVARWGVLLRSGTRTGKLRICEVLYENTYAAGTETFFTSYEKLAKLTGIEKKQCSINIKQLESLGFVERLNIFNTATKQGTEFKLHLSPLSPGARRTPRYHCYDEDLI
jgi:hypothetical protein